MVTAPSGMIQIEADDASSSSSQSSRLELGLTKGMASDHCSPTTVGNVLLGIRGTESCEARSQEIEFPMRNLCGVVILLMFATVGVAQDQEENLSADCGALPITGTFSDLHFDDQREGLVGAEIRIVATNDGYQASLQFANGRLSDLLLGEVEFNVDLRHWSLGAPLPERESDAESVQIVVR